jgi:hypothetical protein
MSQLQSAVEQQKFNLAAENYLKKPPFVPKGTIQKETIYGGT